VLAACGSSTPTLAIVMFALLGTEPVNHVWHYWLAVPLAILAVVTVLGMVLGYFFRVSKTRYPQNN